MQPRIFRVSFIMLVLFLAIGTLPGYAATETPSTPETPGVEESSAPLFSPQRLISKWFSLDPDHPPGIVLFVGRFHPVLVHLPIGILLGLFILELIALASQSAAYDPAAQVLAFLGALTAVVSVCSGLLLSLGGGYNEDLLFRHTWLGTGLMLAVILLWRLKVRCLNGGSIAPRIIYYLVLLGTTALVGSAGHYGGSLTHGKEYLVQHMPPRLQSVLGLSSGKPAEEPVGTRTVYAALVKPVLADRCIRCHGPDKMKGKLRMDSPEALMKGGGTGPVVAAGNAAGSEMVRRITLPEESDEFMPPSGEPLTTEQVELIRWWIDDGASFEKTIEEVELPPALQPLVETLKSASGPKKTKAAEAVKKVPPLTLDASVKEALAALRKDGAIAQPVSQEDQFVRVDFSALSTSVSNQHLSALAPLGDKLAWLNLAGTGITDEGLSKCTGLKGLSRLHLESTDISDQGLTALASLSDLEYLNLHSTKITDAGLTHLAGMSQLKKLFVWNTSVTTAGVETLRKAVPGVEIVLGTEKAAAVEKPAPAPEKTTAQ